MVPEQENNIFGSIKIIISFMQNFVTERKIDEELAKTTRFVADKEQLLTTIKNFGRGTVYRLGMFDLKSCVI